MKIPRCTYTAVVLFSLLLAACGAHRPVFYPNDHFNAVGKDQAQRDADQCMTDARAYGADGDAAGVVGGQAAKGAAVGAATSAVVSAVLGGSVGRAAGAGAAGGATAGAVSGAFDAADPDPVFKNFVERCLRDKGYDVIGWR